MPWYSRPGFVTFVWNCDYRYIYGQTEQTSTPCSSFQTYDIEITVDDSTVTFRDAAGSPLALSAPVKTFLSLPAFR